LSTSPGRTRSASADSVGFLGRAAAARGAGFARQPHDQQHHSQHQHQHQAQSAGSWAAPNCGHSYYLSYYLTHACLPGLQGLEHLHAVTSRSLARKFGRLPTVQRSALAQSWRAIGGLLVRTEEEEEEEGKRGAGSAGRAAPRVEMLPLGAGPDASALVTAAIASLIQPKLATLRSELRSAASADGANDADGGARLGDERLAHACAGSGLALCASASYLLLNQLGARCLQAAESEDGEWGRSLAAHRRVASACARPATRLTARPPTL
jgi:hypothetical protein